MTLDDEYELPQELWSVFCDRESVFEYFSQQGIPTETAFELAQLIRKGKNPEEVQARLKSFSIDPIVIEAVKHIRYLFTRSHTVYFGMLQIRLVWFCLHYPDECRQSLAYEEWADILELIKTAADEKRTGFWDFIKAIE